MFWLVPNKLEQRKEPIGFYLFMRMETILSNFYEELTEVYSELGIADCNVTLPWRQRTVDTWTRKTNYFLMITPVLTKPGHCVPSRQAKCPCFHPHSLQSRPKLFFSFFLFSLVMKQKLVWRRFLMHTWSVNICRFRAHEFSPHHSTRRHVRRSWESWNGVARRE